MSPSTTIQTDDGSLFFSCRPVRSWGAVPADLLGRVSSFAAELPALSTADTTSMEWLYEVVGCDAESLTEEKDDWASATLSSAREFSALSRTVV